MIYRYLFVIWACVAMVIGMQAPNFLSQFEQRLQAQLDEVSINLQGYQAIADEYFAGDLNALVEHYRANPDSIVVESAAPLAQMVTRQQRFSAQQQSLQTHYVGQLWFLLTQADKEVRTATWENYASAIPLSQRALITGLATALLSLLIFDLIWHLLKYVATGRRRHSARAEYRL